MKHTATVFRFIDKCVDDLDNPIQTVENFRLATRIHALQGLGIKDFVIIKGVVLNYFSGALGDALTQEAGTGWSNFMDLMIEVVRDTAKEDETYKKAVLTKQNYGSWMGEKVLKAKKIEKNNISVIVSHQLLEGFSSSCFHQLQPA